MSWGQKQVVDQKSDTEHRKLVMNLAQIDIPSNLLWKKFAKYQYKEQVWASKEIGASPV